MKNDHLAPRRALSPEVVDEALQRAHAMRAKAVNEAFAALGRALFGRERPAAPEAKAPGAGQRALSGNAAAKTV